MVQLLRSKGHTMMTREEEALREHFEILLQQIRQPQVERRLQELDTQVKFLAAASGSLVSTESEYFDEKTAVDLMKALVEMQNGMQNITSALREDFKVVEAIKSSLASAEMYS